MNSKNTKTSASHYLIINHSNKINLKRSSKYNLLSNLIYCTRKTTTNSCKSNKFKISPPTCNEKFELPDRSYSISNIQGKW